ncbi:hypothetical protein [Amycolatopsis speibonae]|uniref:Uncharacterized protein n=1 Tax=Amycolatopsis speibonae TaxID=1450224 RepID=A0ABV7P3G5_9PSEU
MRTTTAGTPVTVVREIVPPSTTTAIVAPSATSVVVVEPPVTVTRAPSLTSCQRLAADGFSYRQPDDTVSGLDDRPHGPSVDARAACSGVPRHPFPRHGEERGVGHEVEQIIKPAAGIGRCPLVQFCLHSQYPLPGRIRHQQQITDVHR